jgi:hypothetical protein
MPYENRPGGPKTKLAFCCGHFCSCLLIVGIAFYGILIALELSGNDYLTHKIQKEGFDKSSLSHGSDTITQSRLVTFLICCGVSVAMILAC